MSPLNWWGSFPLRKSHVDIHAFHAMPMLPMPSGESPYNTHPFFY